MLCLICLPQAVCIRGVNDPVDALDLLHSIPSEVCIDQCTPAGHARELGTSLSGGCAALTASADCPCLLCPLSGRLGRRSSGHDARMLGNRPGAAQKPCCRCAWISSRRGYLPGICCLSDASCERVGRSRNSKKRPATLSFCRMLPGCPPRQIWRSQGSGASYAAAAMSISWLLGPGACTQRQAGS